MEGTGTDRWAEPLGLARRLVAWWALFGGLFLLAIVVMNTYSVISAAVVGRSFAGDYELTEQFVAIAAFSFLPYCQIQGANVTADIFTAGAGPRFLAFMKVVTSVVAVAFAVILAWQMTQGMLDTRRYNYETAVLGVPIWYTYIPIVISLVMLALAGLTTLVESARGVAACERDET